MSDAVIHVKNMIIDERNARIAELEEEVKQLNEIIQNTPRPIETHIHHHHYHRTRKEYDLALPGRRFKSPGGWLE